MTGFLKYCIQRGLVSFIVVVRINIVSYFFNVDFGQLFWQDFGSRDMVLRDPVQICPVFENETPNFRG